MAVAGLVVEVVEGPDAGEQRLLEGELEIGRESAGLALRDELASRHHARLVVDGSMFVVEDLESTNGTLVNGDELHGSTTVHPGDTILIGVSVLELRTPEDVTVRPTVVRPVPPPLATSAKTPEYVPAAVSKTPRSQPQLDRLLDVRVRRQARVAPLGLFVLAALVVMFYLALR